MFCPLSCLTPQCIINHCSYLLCSVQLSCSIIYTPFSCTVVDSSLLSIVSSILLYTHPHQSTLRLSDLLLSTHRLSVILSTLSCSLTQNSSVLSWSDHQYAHVVYTILIWYGLCRLSSISFHFRLSHHKLCWLLSSNSPFSYPIFCCRHSTHGHTIAGKHVWRGVADTKGYSEAEDEMLTWQASNFFGCYALYSQTMKSMIMSVTYKRLNVGDISK